MLGLYRKKKRRDELPKETVSLRKKSYVCIEKSTRYMTKPRLPLNARKTCQACVENEMNYENVKLV